MSGTDPAQESSSLTPEADDVRPGLRVPRPARPASKPSAEGESSRPDPALAQQDQLEQKPGGLETLNAPTSRPESMAGHDAPAVERGGPAVPFDETEEEPEETMVGRVPEGLLAMSARPPPPSVSFEEKTQSFTAPQELMELARRHTRAKDSSRAPVPRSRELGGNSLPHGAEMDGPAPVAAAADVAESPSDSGDRQALPSQPVLELAVTTRPPPEPFDPVVVARLAARDSSPTSQLPDEEMETRRSTGPSSPAEGRPATGLSVDSWLLAVCACVLVGYWVSTLL